MDVIRPHDLQETYDALEAHPDADLLAGGTDLMVEVNLAHHRPDTVVTLRGVTELLERRNGFLGAGVTFAALESCEHAGLAEAARTVGSPQIRAAATLGGNIGTSSPAGDSHPWLAAMDATVHLGSNRGVRAVPWHEFFTGPKRHSGEPDEVILGVAIPPGAPTRQAFAKIGVRQAMVIATVSCCIALDDDGSYRVALGAVGPTVLRARRAEAHLAAGGELGDSELEEFQRIVSEEVSPITDHRSTEQYRRHAAGVLARRTLERLL